MNQFAVMMWQGTHNGFENDVVGFFGGIDEVKEFLLGLGEELEKDLDAGYKDVTVINFHFQTYYKIEDSYQISGLKDLNKWNKIDHKGNLKGFL